MNEEEKKSGQEEEILPGESGEESAEKRRKSRITFDVKMEKIQSVLKLSMNNPLFRQPLQSFGYAAKQFREALKKARGVEKLHGEQKGLQARQHEATRIALQKRKIANDTYMRILKTCRLAFPGDTELTYKLRLSGRRRHSFGGWIAQVTSFYQTILEDSNAVAELARYNIPRNMLETGLEQALEAERASDFQVSTLGDAQNATDMKNRAFKELAEWVRDYLNVADVAFKKVPHLRKEIDIPLSYLP
jgi:hypothetical protein